MMNRSNQFVSVCDSCERPVCFRFTGVHFRLFASCPSKTTCDQLRVMLGKHLWQFCRIKPRKFAKAVRIDRDLVGEPTLVFQVMVKNGKARAGVQKGMYFLATGEIEAGSLNPYATPHQDPSELGVLFTSALTKSPFQALYRPSPRFVP